MLDQDQFRRDSNTSRPSHKKIFPANSKPSKEEKPVIGDLPHCYFHKQEKIIKFCECKQCTLPLCNLCEEIHVNQHEKQSTKAQIKPYNDVKIAAYRSLQRILDTQRQPKESLESRLKDQKQKILQLVNQHFDKMQQALDQHTLSQEQIKILQTREEKIRKGSIKALIQNYSDDYSKVKQLRLYVNFTTVNFVNILTNAISLTSDDILPSLETNRHEKYTRTNEFLLNRTQFPERKKTPTKDFTPFSGTETTFATPIQKQIGTNIHQVHQLQIHNNHQQNKFHEDMNRSKKYEDLKIKFEPFREEKINSQLQQPYSFNRIPGQQQREYHPHYEVDPIKKPSDENIFQQPSLSYRKNIQQYSKNNLHQQKNQNYQNINKKEIIPQSISNNYFFPSRPLTTESLNNRSLNERPFFNTTLDKGKIQYHPENKEKTTLSPAAISPKPISQENIKIALTKPQLLAQRLKNRSLETINRAINSSYTKNEGKNLMLKEQEFAPKQNRVKELLIGQGQQTKRSQYPFEQESRPTNTYEGVLTSRQNYHRERGGSQIQSDRNTDNKSSEPLVNVNTKYEPKTLDNYKRNQENPKIAPSSTIEQTKFFNYKARTPLQTELNNNPTNPPQNTEKPDFKSKYEQYKQRKEEYRNYEANFIKPLPSSSSCSSSGLSKTYKYISNDFPDETSNSNNKPII